MIIGRMNGSHDASHGRRGEAGTLHLLEAEHINLSEQAHSITEPRYPDSLIYGWMKESPIETVEERVERDRRSIKLEGRFA